jgi:hypothetical protein
MDKLLLDISQERNCQILTRGPDKLSQRNLSTNTSMGYSCVIKFVSDLLWVGGFHHQ